LLFAGTRGKTACLVPGPIFRYLPNNGEIRRKKETETPLR
jgi:hypothetical protein